MTIQWMQQSPTVFEGYVGSVHVLLFFSPGEGWRVSALDIQNYPARAIDTFQPLTEFTEVDRAKESAAKAVMDKLSTDITRMFGALQDLDSDRAAQLLSEMADRQPIEMASSVAI